MLGMRQNAFHLKQADPWFQFECVARRDLSRLWTRQGVNCYHSGIRWRKKNTTHAKAARTKTLNWELIFLIAFSYSIFLCLCLRFPLLVGDLFLDSKREYLVSILNRSVGYVTDGAECDAMQRTISVWRTLSLLGPRERPAMSMGVMNFACVMCSSSFCRCGEVALKTKTWLRLGAATPASVQSIVRLTRKRYNLFMCLARKGINLNSRNSCAPHGIRQREKWMNWRVPFCVEKILFEKPNEFIATPNRPSAWIDWEIRDRMKMGFDPSMFVIFPAPLELSLHPTFWLPIHPFTCKFHTRWIENGIYYVK